jgi:hypothetical protein
MVVFPKFPAISNNDSNKEKYNKITEFMYSVVGMFVSDINVYYKVYYLIQLFRYVLDYSDIVLYNINTGKKEDELIKVLKSICKTIHNNPLDQLEEADKAELVDICNKVIQMIEDV